MPALFSLGWLVAATGAGNRIVTWRGRRIRAWPAFNVAIIALVLAYLPALLGSRLSRVYGGE